MKNHYFIYRSKTMKKYLLALSIFALLMGCAPTYYRLYTTPPVNSGECATIVTKYDTKAFILEINGEKMGHGLREIVVEVPPGTVTISPMFADEHGRKLIDVQPVVFPVRSGSTYRLSYSVGEKIGIKNEGRYQWDIYGGYFYLLDLGTNEEIYPVSIGNAAPITPEITVSPSNKNSAVEWAMKGTDFSDNKQYEKAIECFDKALIADPSYNVYPDRGKTLFLMGRYSEAIADLTKGIEANAYWSYYYRGLSYNKLGKRKEALDDLKLDCETYRNPEACGAYESMK